MKRLVDVIESRLSDEDKERLQSMYTPTVVATPMADARRHVCVLRDGEIRSYGEIGGDHVAHRKGAYVYLSSVDGGLSWKQHQAKGKMHACTYIPAWDTYVGTADGQFNTWGDKQGLWVTLSAIGPDDPNPTIIKLSDERYGDTFQPQKSAYSDRLWFTSQVYVDGECTVNFFYSNDRGHTWEHRQFPHPAIEDLGPRWCRHSGTEPYAMEMSEGHMLMLVRTPDDCFYQMESFDGGDTWSAPVPSTFYGRNTTPYILRLADGRIITFWNNTRPMPVPDYADYPYPMPGGVENGTGESGFTNRDAAHAAITEDGGKTWIGYREFLLNPIRNRSDFRYYGGTDDTVDKSVHQFQAFELPYGKVLVCAGQNRAARRLVIFDVNWLYETARQEDFFTGLEGLTTHAFLKSYVGSTAWTEAKNGHCSFNRTHGAVLMPDPQGGFREHLYIRKSDDPTLLTGVGGAAWNFPLSKTGRVTVELILTEQQAHLSLTDRWGVPCDPSVQSSALFPITLDAAELGTDPVTVILDYDTAAGTCAVTVDGKTIGTVPMARPCPTGVCYLILQCATEAPSRGFYVRRLEKA